LCLNLFTPTMTNSIRLNYFCFVVCFLLAMSTYAQTGEVYTFKDPSLGGTGKWYMAREIAQLMSFQGKDWLERDSRPNEENTALAISKLPVTNNRGVGDIGAGTGYYTFRIAEKVPEGKVYA